MIALRLLALVAGFLVLILPAVALPESDTAGMSTTSAGTALIGMTLVSASFVYVGMAGEHMRRSARARMLGAALLVVPILGSLGLLVTRQDSNLLWASGMVLVLSLVLFMGVVFAMTTHRQRPMRQREGLV